MKTDIRELIIQVKGESYPILLSERLEGLADKIREIRPGSGKIGVIADSNVYALYGEILKEELEKTGREIFFYVQPAGEEHKNLDSIRQIYGFLMEHRFDRQDLLCAFGGGVTGDMTGFTAATYLRGLDFIQVPTTLLADVDSSIGGKTGVDFQNYKNMVGAFKQPVLVYTCLSFLKSLPERQFSTGMAEIVKHGFIRSREYLALLENSREEILRREPSALLPVIEESLRIKKAVVEEDPTEKGIRAILNFGHTIGHALEKESGFTLTHGEGVSLGSAAALWISEKKGFLSREERDRGEALLKSFGLPLRRSDFDTEAVLQNTRQDKKRAGSAVRFILLQGLGHAVIDLSVSEAEIREALLYLKEN